MANRLSKKRKLDGDIFKKYLKDRQMSIRLLGEEITANEKTIRLAVQEEKISITIAVEICDYFNDTCFNIFGPDDSQEWRTVCEYLK